MRKFYLPHATLSYSTGITSPNKESIPHTLIHAVVGTKHKSFFKRSLHLFLLIAFSVVAINYSAKAQTISVSPTPASFGNVCTGSSSLEQTFTITGNSLTIADVTVAALSGYQYSTVSGGPYVSSLSFTQPGGSFTQIIYIRFSPTAVQSYNGNIVVGGGGAADFNVVVTGNGITTPSTPGTITGTATQCPALTLQTYSIPAVTDATTYTWAVPTGWTITAGAGTTSITITTGATAQNGNVTVTAGNLCGISAASSLAVTVSPGTPATPGTITGTATQCPALTLQTYSITAVTNATTYTWAVPTGWTITAGAGTTSITVTTGATGQNGNITVMAGNSCGTSAASSLAVTVSPGTPATPGTITGTASQCPALAGQTFSVVAVTNATTYTWVVPTGWTITAGAGTTSITVTTGASGQNGNISVTAGNSCGTSAASNLAVIVNTVVTPSVIITANPTGAICAGTSVTFTATPTNGGAAPSYQWQLNGSPVGSNSNTYTNSALAQGDKVKVILTPSVPCPSTATATSNELTMTVNAVVAPSVSIVSTSPVFTTNPVICPGVSVTFLATPTNGGTTPTYQWKINGVNAGTNSATFVTTALINGDKVTVDMSSNAVCASPLSATSNQITVTVNPGTPAIPGTITGTATVCPAITTLTYSIGAVTNATTYTWAVPAGWSITGGQGTTSITVTSGSAGQNGNVGVTAGNSCGTSLANTFAVTVSPGTPATPGTVTGTTPVCPGITGNVYSISAVANANVNGYVWTVPTGWSVTAGVGTNSITVTSGSAGQNGNITVTASNSCGVSAAQTKAVTVSAATPATPGAITGTTPVCPAVTAIVYSISAVANATSYTWIVPTGWSITAGTGTNSVTVTSGSTGQNGNITVTATNSCGTSLASSLAVTVSAGTPATPGTITGSAAVCPATNLTYSIVAVSNATSYAWTVPAGWSITGGQGTISITVTSGTAGQNGNVSVTASNNCGTSAANTLAVTVSPATPATPGGITGLSPLCASSTNNGYSISLVSNATTYTWAVPSGWTITGGQGTTSILVTAGTIAGNITVTAGNTCGTSSAQTLAVAITSGVPPTPGSITGLSAICPTKTPTYSISAVSGATGYTWTLPANWSITSGQGTTTIVTNAPLNAATGNISVTANNVCGSSPTSSLAVTVSNSATVYAGPDQTVCFGAASVNLQGVTGGAITKASEWQWVLVSGGSLNPTSGSNAALLSPTYTFPNGSSTTGTLTVVIKSNVTAVGCPFTTDTMNVIIIPIPTVTTGSTVNICQSATPSAITLSGASVGGGATTGAWSITSGGGTLSSTAQTGTPSAVTYTPAANFTGTVTLTLTTNTPAACSAVSATRNINVNPAPTVIPGGPDNVCQSATPSAITLSGASVGGGATTGAWSITLGGGTLSSTAQTGTPATVTYTPAANFMGTVTLTLTTNAIAPCLAVSATRTINVNAASTVTPGGPDNVCQSATLSAITLSGASVGGGATTGAWSITSGGGTLSSVAQTGTPSSVTYTPAANFTGTVTLTLTTNATSPCSAISATRTINVNAASTVTPGGPDNVCQSATPSALTLSGASVGGGATTGAWSITSGGGTLSSTAQTLTPATVTYTPAANFTGTVTLTLTTNATAPCSAISATRTINVNAASTVTPGGPDNVCQSATPSAITLSGASVGGGATTGAWSITSGGGTLSSVVQTATPSTVTYTPAANFTGTVTLTLTTNATSPCSATSATRTINVNAAATVSAGVAQTICSNTTATMAGSFGGGAGLATWTTSGTGSFNNNTTTAIYTPSAADIFAGTVTLTYTTDDPTGPCGPVTANMVLTIKKAVVIGTQPSNTSVCASLPADLTVVASGDGLAYQWYKGTAPGGSAVTNSANITGATSNNLHFNNAGLADGGSYYVIVSGFAPACSAVTSATISLTVDQSITVTTQPVSQTICAAANVTFSVVADANGSPLTYQWRKNGSNISGQTGTSLTINGLVTGDAGNYDVVVTGPSGYTCSSANSTAAVLTVNPVSVGGTVSSAQTICTGSTPANLTLAGNTGTVVKWQKASDVAFTTPTDIANTTTTLTGATIGALSTPTYFRAVVQSGVCLAANSSSILISIDPVSVGGTVSSAQTICTGSTPANLTLAGNTGSVVKWQKASDAAFTTPIDIANTSTTLTGTTIGALSTPTYFRAVVQSGVCLAANSSSILISIDPVSVGGTVSSVQTICNGSSLANLTLVGNTGTVVKWQKASDVAFTTPTDIANTTTTLTGATIGALSASTYFRAVIKSGTCLAVNSSSVLITVDPSSVGGTVSSAQTICNGSIPANLTLAGNTGTVVKWQKASDAAFTTPTDIANTSTTLTGATIGALSTSTYFRAVVQSGSCVAVNSSSVLITINAAAVGGTLSLALKTECIGANSGTITLSAYTGSVIKWEQSLDFGSTWQTRSPANTTDTLKYLNLTQTIFYRAVVQSGVCVTTVNSVYAQVIVNPAFVATITPSPAAVCIGVPLTLTASGYTSSGLIIPGGTLDSVSQFQWGGANGNASNNNTATDFIWGYTNPGKTYSGNIYSSASNGGGTFYIVAGTPPTNPSILTTPTFSTFGLSTALLVFNEAYDLRAGTIAKVEISTDGGTSYTTLKTYTGVAFQGPTNGMTFLEAIDLNAYLGRSNLKLRFNYLGSTGSVWAIDNVVVTNSISNPSGIGALNPLTYSWSPATDLNVTNTQSVILTPTTSGVKTYTVTTTAGTCTPKTTDVIVTVSPVTVAGTLPSVSVCTSGTGTLTLTGNTGSVVRWESSLDNFATAGTVIANTTTSQSYTAAATTIYYRAYVQSGTCTAAYSTIATVGLHNVWTGFTSINWNTPSNWSDGLLPTASVTCPDVIITNVTNKPILSAGTATINNLIINSGASLTVTGATLQIAGTITNASGIFDVSNGSLDFNGTTAQSIAANLFLGNNLKNLTVSNTSLSVFAGGGLLNITGDLAFGNISNATLTTNDNIVLVSTATSTARVADITNGGARSGNTFSGKVTVQRYFPALRAWRLITSPLSNTGNIFSTWQNGGTYTIGKGTLVTGAVLQTATNGLDNGPFLNPSLKAGSNLTDVADTKAMSLSGISASAANIGYLMFVRGDRNPINTTVPNTNITTLSSKGNLQTGTQTFNATGTSGAYTLIGNPYASSVDLSLVTLNNLVNRFYVWDPKLSSVGGYVLIEGPSPYIFSPSPSPGAPTQHIQSSEAFFVQTFSTNPASIVFNESNKSSSNNLSMFRPMNPAPLQSLKTNLYMLNADGTRHMADGNLAQFDDSYNAGVDLQDALKFGNVNETFGVLSGTTALALDRRPPLANTDTVFFSFAKARQLKYQFEFTTELLERDNLAGFVEDKFIQKLSPLNMNGINKVDFEVTAATGSAAIDRFRVVFKPSVVYTKLSAAVLSSDIGVEWNVASELDIKAYDVERSTDGVNFTKMGTVTSAGNSTTPVTYTWLDKSPALGHYYYRIRSVSNSNVVGHSNIAKVKINKSTPAIYVFPNPVTDNILQLQMNGMPQGVYGVRLMNSLGQAVVTNRISHTAGTSTETIRPERKLIAGVYELQVTAPDKKITMVKIIVN